MSRQFSLRQKLGVIVFDLPKFIRIMQLVGLTHGANSPWIYLHNRNEALAWEEGKNGVLCDWQWTSDLHAAKVFPSLGVLLMKRALREWPIVFAGAPNVTQDNIEISFIVGHKGIVRLPHLLTTLQSIAAQCGVTFECIVVEQSVNAEVKEVLPHWIRYVHTPLPHPDMPYCRSWAFNVGARIARGQLLVFHDNDVCVPTHYGWELLKLRAYGYQAMRLQRFVFYLNPPTTLKVMNDCRIPATIGLDSVSQNCEGHTFAVERETYFQLGGHDEAFVGWGGEDNEFFQRCQTVKLYSYTYLPFIHLYHAPQPGKGSNQGRRTAEVFEARSAIPAAQRITELAARHFGNREQLDPPYSPRVTPRAESHTATERAAI